VIENHIITTATGVVFNFLRDIITKAAVSDVIRANIMPCDLLYESISKLGLNRNSGLAIITTPAIVTIPVNICSKPNGSLSMKYARITTKTGDEKWIVKASARGIKRYAI